MAIVMRVEMTLHNIFTGHINVLFFIWDVFPVNHQIKLMFSESFFLVIFIIVNMAQFENEWEKQKLFFLNLFFNLNFHTLIKAWY